MRHVRREKTDGADWLGEVSIIMKCVVCCCARRLAESHAAPAIGVPLLIVGLEESHPC